MEIAWQRSRLQGKHYANPTSTSDFRSQATSSIAHLSQTVTRAITNKTPSSSPAIVATSSKRAERQFSSGENVQASQPEDPYISRIPKPDATDNESAFYQAVWSAKPLKSSRNSSRSTFDEPSSPFKPLLPRDQFIIESERRVRLIETALSEDTFSPTTKEIQKVLKGVLETAIEFNTTVVNQVKTRSISHGRICSDMKNTDKPL